MKYVYGELTKRAECETVTNPFTIMIDVIQQIPEEFTLNTDTHVSIQRHTHTASLE